MYAEQKAVKDFSKYLKNLYFLRGVLKMRIARGQLTIGCGSYISNVHIKKFCLQTVGATATNVFPQND